MFLPQEREKEVEEFLKDCKALDIWWERISDEKLMVRLLIPVGASEEVLDRLQKSFSHLEDFRIILLPVQATIPKPEEEVEEESREEAEKARISREELYYDVSESAKLTEIYFALILLSSIVAAIGILKGNVAVIIGAIVIAPLIGPFVALSLATTLWDTSLIKNSLKTSLAGIFASLGLSVVLGVILDVDPQLSEISSRTSPGLGDIVLALASGSAGALAFTTGISASLIGVMVAVALLPPVVTGGMLLGAGHLSLALGALLLLLSNIICINLAGVVTFLAQGIQPRNWWEAKKAKKYTARAILLWIFLLALLAAILFLTAS